jgi:hypothetical protein
MHTLAAFLLALVGPADPAGAEEVVLAHDMGGLDLAAALRLDGATARPASTWPQRPSRPEARPGSMPR